MLHPKYSFVGIDYGSKLAGTTTLVYSDLCGQLCVLQSAKKQDADRWLREHLEELSPISIYIDAPLSLPGSYYGKTADYFYRICDRQLNAMSPMFLGGLTARAMRLKSQYAANWKEVYPSALVKELLWSSFYKKKEVSSIPKMKEKLDVYLGSEIRLRDLDNYHQIDGVLAWITGYRDSKNEALSYGQTSEGLIWV